MSIHESTPNSVFTREAIALQDYSSTNKALEVEKVLTELILSELGAKAKRYEILRLFLGRSLFETNKLETGSKKPTATSSKNNLGHKDKPIQGVYLFSDDVNIWASIIIIDGQLTHESTMSDFKERVEYHLDRGASLIHQDLERSTDIVSVLKLYSNLLASKSSFQPSNDIKSSSKEVLLKLGNISQMYPSKKVLEYTLNKVGQPPHIALMGAIGKGKSTTGMQIAKQIVDQASIPILVIDPKGEFVQNGKLSSSIANWNNASINPIEVGNNAIPLDFLPTSSIGRTGIQNAAMRFRDSIAACSRSVGDLQRNRIHQVIEKIIINDDDRSLENIKGLYLQELMTEGSDKDSVYSTLHGLTSLNCFKPVMNSSEFFNKSWVISLSSIESEEIKKLVVMLLLDAARTHILRQTDSEKVGNIQSLRNLIVLDEARKVMASNKSESLSDLIRLGRSKGLVVMLLSQDPTDFQGASDDFLKQIGTCVAFACNSGDKGLANLGNLYGQKLLPGQFADPELTSGLAFCKWPDNPPAKIRCWEI